MSASATPEEYGPDEEAFDALVDLEGAAAPPPTPAEVAIAGMDPVDAVEVIVAAEQAADVAEVHLVAGSGSLEERARMWVALRSVIDRLGVVAKEVEKALASDLDGPVEVDGVWWEPGSRRSVTGWDRPAMNAAINRAVLGDVDDVNRETGEVTQRPPTPGEVVDRMWRYVQAAEGRTAKLAEVGVDPDEYATVAWVPALKKLRDDTAAGSGGG